MRIYKEYPTEQHKTVHEPGTRFYATGFRVSDPPSKIVRNMPPVLVQFTYGGRTPDGEAEAARLAQGRPASYIAPVRADGTPDLAKTCTTNDVRLFSDRADAEDCYRDHVVYALEDIADAQARLACFKDAVTDVLASATRPARD